MRVKNTDKNDVVKEMLRMGSEKDQFQRMKEER